MRRLLLALMIVLLPLRGWMGDVMAMEAVTGAQNAIYSIADNGPMTLGSTHYDGDSGRLTQRGGPVHRPDHAATSGDSSEDTDGDHATHGVACTACQICHTVALSADIASFPALPLPTLAPALSFPGFANAPRAPGLKPPIS